jgi:hypothetical protein
MRKITGQTEGSKHNNYQQNPEKDARKYFIGITTTPAAAQASLIGPRCPDSFWSAEQPA